MKEDERAIEGLPLKLLIIAVVLAIALPMVYSSIRYYDTQRLKQDVESQAEFIGSKARQLRVHGEGNSEVINIDIRDGLFRSVEFLEIGNETFRDRIRWSVEGQGDSHHRIEGDVNLVSDDGPLMLREGEHRLRLECKFGEVNGSEEDMLYIKIERL